MIAKAVAVLAVPKANANTAVSYTAMSDATFERQKRCPSCGSDNLYRYLIDEHRQHSSRRVKATCTECQAWWLEDSDGFELDPEQ